MEAIVLKIFYWEFRVFGSVNDQCNFENRKIQCHYSSGIYSTNEQMYSLLLLVFSAYGWPRKNIWVSALNLCFMFYTLKVGKSVGYQFFK